MFSRLRSILTRTRHSLNWVWHCFQFVVEIVSHNSCFQLLSPKKEIPPCQPFNKASEIEVCWKSEFNCAYSKVFEAYFRIGFTMAQMIRLCNVEQHIRLKTKDFPIEKGMNNICHLKFTSNFISLPLSSSNSNVQRKLFMHNINILSM